MHRENRRIDCVDGRLSIRSRLASMRQRSIDQVFRNRIGYWIDRIVKCLFSQLDRLLILAYKLRAVAAHLEVQPTPYLPAAQ